MISKVNFVYNMKCKSLHITLLVFVHLVIFVTAFSIKTGHHHETALANGHSGPSGSGISKHAPCFVCQFEFVPFIPAPVHPFSFFLNVNLMDPPDFYRGTPLPGIIFASLRAPPKF